VLGGIHEAQKDKERHSAELSAGERLLKSGAVRAAAVWAVLSPVLVWIATTFAESSIGNLADQTWKLLAKILGFDL
jgi:hypothetical protein